MMSPSGAPWEYATVRAGEPGGGALLQTCSTHTSCSGQLVSHRLQHGANSPALYLLYPALLPTVLSEHTETSLRPRSPPSPSVPLLTPADGSAAPPGLIAPLSPRLAEEDDDLAEDDDGNCWVQPGSTFECVVGSLPVRVHTGVLCTLINLLNNLFHSLIFTCFIQSTLSAESSANYKLTLTLHTLEHPVASQAPIVLSARGFFLPTVIKCLLIAGIQPEA